MYGNQEQGLYTRDPASVPPVTSPCCKLVCGEVQMKKKGNIRKSETIVGSTTSVVDSVKACQFIMQ